MFQFVADNLWIVLLSAIWLPVAWPLYRDASRGSYPARITPFDCLCLTIAVVCFVIAFPLVSDGFDHLADKWWFHSILAVSYLPAFFPFIAGWWWLIATSMSKVGITSYRSRAVCEIVIPPFAILAPFFVPAQLFHSAMYLEADIYSELAKWFLCLFVYVGCVAASGLILQNGKIEGRLKPPAS